jgi:hypothetical protein
MQPLVRTDVVVLRPERIELALLPRTGPLHGTDRLPLERAVHALVRAILLGATGMNPLIRSLSASWIN